MTDDQVYSPQIGEGINFIDDRKAPRDTDGLIRFVIRCSDDPSEVSYVRASSSIAAYHYALNGYLEGLMDFIEEIPEKMFQSSGLDEFFRKGRCRETLVRIGQGDGDFSKEEIKVLFCICFGENGYEERPGAVELYSPPDWETLDS